MGSSQKTGIKKLNMPPASLSKTLKKNFAPPRPVTAKKMTSTWKCNKWYFLGLFLIINAVHCFQTLRHAPKQRSRFDAPKNVNLELFSACDYWRDPFYWGINRLLAFNCLRLQPQSWWDYLYCGVDLLLIMRHHGSKTIAQVYPLPPLQKHRLSESFFHNAWKYFIHHRLSLLLGLYACNRGDRHLCRGIDFSVAATGHDLLGIVYVQSLHSRILLLVFKPPESDGLL